MIKIKDRIFNKFEETEKNKIIAVIKTIFEDEKLSKEIDLESFQEYVEVWEENTITTIVSNTEHKFYVFESFEDMDFFELMITNFNDEEIENKANDKYIETINNKEWEISFLLNYNYNLNEAFHLIKQNNFYEWINEEYFVYCEIIK